MTARVDDPALQQVARQLSVDDYCFDKPPLDKAMQGLTIGEEHGYYVKGCKTMGAVYSSRISESSVEFSVKLPPSLQLHGMTKEEAEGHEHYIHNELEKCIVWIVRWHKIKRGEPA